MSDLRFAVTLVCPRREHLLGVFDAEGAAQFMADFDGRDAVEVLHNYVDPLARCPRTWTGSDGVERPNRRAMGWGPTPLEITVEITDLERSS